MEHHAALVPAGCTDTDTDRQPQLQEGCGAERPEDECPPASGRGKENKSLDTKSAVVICAVTVLKPRTPEWHGQRSGSDTFPTSF